MVAAPRPVACVAVGLMLAWAAGCTPAGDGGGPGGSSAGGSGAGGNGATSGNGGSRAGGNGGSSGAGGSQSSTGGAAGGNGATSGSGGSGTGGTGGSYAGGSGGSGTGGSGGLGPDGGTADQAAGGTGGSGGAPSGALFKMLKLDTTAAGAAVMGDVPRYPVAVVLTAASFDFSQAKPKGEDIRFASAEGATLPHAIESWDSTAKLAAVWVKVDVKGNSTQLIKMSWGDPAATDTSNSAAVFATQDGFAGVWHLNEPGSTTADGYKDATANAAHATGVAMTAASTGDGRIGKAALLALASRQWIQVGLEKSKLYDMPNKMTYSVWAFAKTHTTSYQAHLTKGEGGFRLHYFGTTDIVETCLESGAGNNDLCPVNNNGTRVVDGQWFHLVGTHDHPRHTIYVNGKLDAAFMSNELWKSDPTKPVMIGNNSSSTGRSYDGLLDEARIMNVAKDDHWIKLEYESQREGQKFLTFVP